MNTDIIMNNTSSPSRNTNNAVAVKVTRGTEMRRFQFNGKSFQEIKALIAMVFNIPATDDFTLQYQDDEKDKVTLSSDAELNEAIKLHKYVLRFYVVNRSAPTTAAATLPVFPLSHQPVSPVVVYPHHHAPATPGENMVVADNEALASPPHYPHHGHHHRGHHHGHGPYGGMRGGRRGGHGHGPDHHHEHHHHEHHKMNKRSLDKEEREAWKLEKKRFKKQRKCDKESSSSSSSSSEEDVQKVQKKEMKMLMKATKQQIKKNWAATKDANPAQWPENRKLMIAEIKAAKKLILEQANSNTLVPVEQSVAVTNVTTEMQA